MKVFVDFVLLVWLYTYVYECVCVYWCMYDKVLVHRERHLLGFWGLLGLYFNKSDFGS